MKKGRNLPDEVNGDRPSQQCNGSPYYNFPQHSRQHQVGDYHELNPMTIGVPQGHEYCTLNMSPNNRVSGADGYEEVH